VLSVDVQGRFSPPGRSLTRFRFLMAIDEVPLDVGLGQAAPGVDDSYKLPFPVSPARSTKLTFNPWTQRSYSSDEQWIIQHGPRQGEWTSPVYSQICGHPRDCRR